LSATGNEQVDLTVYPSELEHHLPGNERRADVPGDLQAE
jgi:hypothetical protein